MTLDDLERQNRGFMDFLAAATQNHSRGGATVSLYIIILYALRYDCNNGVLFYPKFSHRFSLYDFVVL